MIDYETHNYSLLICSIVLLKGKEHIMFFDNNKCCKEKSIKLKFYLKEGKM